MEGYVVRTAEDGAAALTELTAAPYDMVISDLKMPRMGGIELLDAIATKAPNALTVIMTGFGTVETAIDAMKRGAYDYILKPFKVEEVIHVVQRGLEKQRLSAENLRLKEAAQPLQGERGHRGQPFARRGVGHPERDGAARDQGRSRLRLLEDGEGGYFERQRLTQMDAAIESEFGHFAPQAFIDHFANDSTLLEQGNRGSIFFKSELEVPLKSLLAFRCA